MAQGSLGTNPAKMVTISWGREIRFFKRWFPIHSIEYKKYYYQNELFIQS